MCRSEPLRVSRPQVQPGSGVWIGWLEEELGHLQGSAGGEQHCRSPLVGTAQGRDRSFGVGGLVVLGGLGLDDDVTVGSSVEADGVMSRASPPGRLGRTGAVS
jgi:hypothetical protein